MDISPEVDARAVSLLLRSRANVHAIGDSVKDGGDVTGVGRLEILDLMCMMSFKYFDGKGRYQKK